MASARFRTKLPGSTLDQRLVSFLREAQERLEDTERRVRLGAMYGRVVNGTPTIAAIGEYFTATGAFDEVLFVLPLAEGDRLLEVSAYGNVAVATPWIMQLVAFDVVNGGVVQVGPVNFSSTSPGWSKVPLPNQSLVVASPIYYAIRWFSNAVNNRVRAVEYLFDRPR